MKCFALFAFVVVAAVSGTSVEEFRQRVGPVARECQPKVGATDEDVYNLLNRIELKTPSGMCLAKCFYATVGITRDDRMASNEEILKVWNEVYAGNEERLKVGKYIVETCAKLGKNIIVDCIKAAEIEKCVADHLQHLQHLASSATAH